MGNHVGESNINSHHPLSCFNYLSIICEHNKHILGLYILQLETLDQDYLQGCETARIHIYVM